VKGPEDDAVAVDALAEGVTLGQQQEAELAVTADGSRSRARPAVPVRLSTTRTG
jgi:hypothetical protein